MAELGIILLCFILAIPFRVWLEREAGIDAEHGAPLSAQVLEQIAQAQERDASNNWDYER